MTRGGGSCFTGQRNYNEVTDATNDDGVLDTGGTRPGCETDVGTVPMTCPPGPTVMSKAVVTAEVTV